MSLFRTEARANKHPHVLKDLKKLSQDDWRIVVTESAQRLNGQTTTLLSKRLDRVVAALVKLDQKTWRDVVAVSVWPAGYAKSWGSHGRSARTTTNREGLTWMDWQGAAFQHGGLPQNMRTTEGKKVTMPMLRREWREGVDPTEWSAVFSRARRDLSRKADTRIDYSKPKRKKPKTRKNPVLKFLDEVERVGKLADGWGNSRQVSSKDEPRKIHGGLNDGGWEFERQQGRAFETHTATWLVEDNYCYRGRPFFRPDEYEKALAASETEKILVTHGPFQFVWMWDELLRPTQNNWGMRMGPTFFAIRRDGEELWRGDTKVGLKRAWKRIAAHRRALREADDVGREDLEAAADFYDKLAKRGRGAFIHSSAIPVRKALDIAEIINTNGTGTHEVWERMDAWVAAQGLRSVLDAVKSIYADNGSKWSTGEENWWVSQLVDKT